jgi:ABC-type molybdate transport system substrate-binding protein
LRACAGANAAEPVGEPSCSKEGISLRLLPRPSQLRLRHRRTAGDHAGKSITVFAAASMKNALDDVDAPSPKQSGIKVVASYAASSALMKQIEQGAPADVFLSADIDWMDYGAKRNLIKNDTRTNLLGNRLVLIAPKDSKIGNVNIAPGFDLAALAGDGRIAVGDVRAVPAGLYAKAALEKLGAWAAVEPKWRWPRTCAPRSFWSRAARRRSASSTKPTPRSTPA